MGFAGLVGCRKVSTTMARFMMAARQMPDMLLGQMGM
jgi:hypothetical protein